MSDSQPPDLRHALQSALGATYVVERELGGGGMSRVFVVRDESLGRDVVVKVLAPEQTQGLSIERFAREIKLAAALQEPHIVPVHSAGHTADGLPYYSMPFVRGESLRNRMAKGPVPLDESITILRDVALALAYAHRQGIVHRDIKPENILLSEGTAVVTDFGIAKALQAARTAGPETLTQTGTSIGSPMYMAPEQAAADPSTDQRADVYAWGVVAYELITGKHPFADRTSPQQMLAAQMSATPPPINASTPGIPRPLVALVMRCLSKEPSERPANGTEIVAALNAPASARYQRVATPAATRNRALGAVAIVVVIASAGLIWRTRTASASDPPLIAVLPFDTEGAAADSSFADGLSDAVTGKLASLAGLRVIDRKSVLSLAGSAGKTAQQAGKSLGAEYVLRASVRWAKGADGQSRVRVSPSLVRVSDGTTKWAGEPQVVSPADPFTIQASVATRVAEALDVAMGARERTKLSTQATTDTGAFAAVVRGKRLNEENTSNSYTDYARALREFEHAYKRDPHYADAFGMAASTLAIIGQVVGGKSALDSASVLAEKALQIDPNQPDAIRTLVIRAGVNDKMREAVSIAERAVRANPSSVSLLRLQMVILVNVGDSAGSWHVVEQILPLAPASPAVLSAVFYTASVLRRFDDAAKFLAQRKRLDPLALSGFSDAAGLAEKLGDSIGVARSVGELRSHGGKVGSGDVNLLRHGDSALQQELATAPIGSFGPTSAFDSANIYSEKAKLFMKRGDDTRARLVEDSASVLLRRILGGAELSLFQRRYYESVLAWHYAVLGDRAAALAALNRASRGAANREYPNNLPAATITCLTAEVYGLLDDVDAMLPIARRCFTMPNGLPVAFLHEPEFARHRNDPRLRDLFALDATPRSVVLTGSH